MSVCSFLDTPNPPQPLAPSSGISLCSCLEPWQRPAGCPGRCSHMSGQCPLPRLYFCSKTLQPPPFPKPPIAPLFLRASPCISHSLPTAPLAVAWALRIAAQGSPGAISLLSIEDLGGTWNITFIHSGQRGWQALGSMSQPSGASQEGGEGAQLTWTVHCPCFLAQHCPCCMFQRWYRR